MDWMLKTVSVACLVACLLASCSDDGDDKASCDASYVSACTRDLKGVTVCEDGVVVTRPCASGVCDVSQAQCVEACSESSLPASCLDGKTRVWCDAGVRKTGQCEAGESCQGGTCVKAQTCDANFQTRCNDGLTGYISCEQGREVETPCPSGICIASSGKCQGIVSPDSCTPEDYPATCIDAHTRAWCAGGVKKTMSCGSGETCVDGGCKDTLTTCGADYVETCETPLIHTYCKDGVVTRELCKNGQICNALLKTKSCRVPAYGDSCSPATFSEGCFSNDTVARTCDAETGKVVDVSCDKYSVGSKCDIAPDFYGPGANAVMCVTKEDACNEPGETESLCYGEYDKEDDYTYFYERTLTCAKFNLGNYFYVSGEEPCDGSCNADKTHCR